MSKLVLCDASLFNDSQFVGSFKDDCSVVNVNTYDNVDAVNVDGVTHLALAWHYPGYSEPPFFRDNRHVPREEGETPEPYKQEYRYFSNNLISLFRRLEDGAVVDLLCCNLNSDDFKECVEKVETDLGVNIRYSVDQTGNEPHGNWVMESDGTDVKNVYFTDAIDEWNGVLDESVAPSSINGVNVDGLFSYDNTSNTLKLLRNATWTDVSNALGGNTNFIELSNNEIFDGQGYTIDLTGVTGFAGLFACSSPIGADENNRAVIKNLGMLNGETADFKGFIVRIIQRFFEVNNCYSTGSIGDYAGGICGSSAGHSNGVCEVTNCYSTGSIGSNAGGICGELAGVKGNCIVTNCYSTGSIGDYAGGICGIDAGSYNYGECTVTNCYSTGNIGDMAGGICGTSAGFYHGRCTVTNCYSTGRSIDDMAGGICGTSAGSYGECTVTNCYSQQSMGITIANGTYPLDGDDLNDLNFAADICGNAFIDVGPTYSYPVLQAHNGVAMLQIITDTTKTIDSSSSNVNAAVIDMSTKSLISEHLGQKETGIEQLYSIIETNEIELSRGSLNINHGTQDNYKVVNDNTIVTTGHDFNTNGLYIHVKLGEVVSIDGVSIERKEDGYYKDNTKIENGSFETDKHKWYVGSVYSMGESVLVPETAYFSFIPLRRKLGASARVNLPTGLRNLVKRR